MALTKVSRGLLSTGIVDNSTTTAITIDSSENVGIGREPRVMLDVAGEAAIAYNANYGLRFYNQPQNNWSSIGNNLTSSAANLVFKDSTGEAMRIESGNLFVGGSVYEGSTTSNASSAYIASSGFISANVTDDFGMQVNRTGTDGKLFNFRKNGVDVGSIGVENNDNFYIGATAAGHGGLYFGSQNMSPMAAGVRADATMDVGAASYRFKNVYLSGFVRAGAGTAADPVLTGSDGNTGFFFPSGGVTCFTQNGVERGRIDSGGDVFIASLGVYPSASQTGFAYRGGAGGNGFIATGVGGTNGLTHHAFYNPNGVCGQIYTTGSGTVYVTSSDYRLKENVVGITGATQRLLQLKPSRFNFIADANITVDGFLAHEVADVVPEAIVGTKDAVDADGNPEYQGIDQSKLVPLLVATIQELEARLTALENN